MLARTNSLLLASRRVRSLLHRSLRTLQWGVLGLGLLGGESAFFCLTGIAGGQSASAVPGHPAFPSDLEERSAEELARLYCGTCHLYPEPDLLDLKTWQEGALDWMKVFMGLAPERVEQSAEADLLKATGKFPESPIIASNHWAKIEAFYLGDAPQSPLPQKAHPPIRLGLPEFKVLKQRYRKSTAMTTLVRIVPDEQQIYVGDANRLKLDRLDAKGMRVSTMDVGNMPVDMDFTERGFFLTSIGDFFPSERDRGDLIRLERKGQGYRRHVIREGLPRPSHLESADLNGDGCQDFVLSMFGNFAGRFSWFENRGATGYTEHTLLQEPGAVRSAIADLNGDKRPDIAVLVAQATESFFIFNNLGGNKFRKQVIFQKPPVYGHTFFELVDFNGDDRLDIIVTNGDNGEYKPSPPKRYHGIRIYLNQGDQRFEESYFYPLNGCFKALARDYDGDGDKDIAAISYFPDYKDSPRESFVYLENQGGLDFAAKTFPECISGRWLTMDAGDLDGDNDIDLVLGSATKGPGTVPDFLKATWKRTGMPILILENRLQDESTSDNPENSK